MEKILIVGKDSYIGSHFKNWMAQQQPDIVVDELSVLDDGWKEFSFKGYDVVLHVAGIAHVSTDPTMEDLYYRVNRDLTAEVAAKAKLDGVGQFVFMSSMIIYGADSGVGQTKMISRDTMPDPENFYGRSKLMAEEKIRPMEDDSFYISMIRPPMVYGPGCKGNFPRLLKLARKCPVFPSIRNERSMIYIDNLCEFLRLVIIHRRRGIFFPQNAEYVCTGDIIVEARKIFGKHTYQIALFNPIIKLLSGKVGVVNKVFGSKTYAKELSVLSENYQVVDFERSVELSVVGL